MDINAFIKKCTKTDNAIGDFCNDIIRDKNFPSEKNIEQILSYLDFQAHQNNIVEVFEEFKFSFFLNSNYQERLKKLIIGEWKFIDGRKIEFFPGEEYLLKDENGKPFDDEKHKIFISTEKNGTIILGMPLMLEPMAIFKSISNDLLIYESCRVDGTREEIGLTKIN